MVDIELSNTPRKGYSMVTSLLCTQNCDSCVCLILVADMPVNLSVFGHILGNSFSFQYADLVAL